MIFFNENEKTCWNYKALLVLKIFEQAAQRSLGRALQSERDNRETKSHNHTVNAESETKR
jgi:hypothetical protein